MHPILFRKQLKDLLPPSMYESIAQGGYITNHWHWWLGGMLVCAAIAWWGLAPQAQKMRRAIGWLTTLGAFGFALLLGSIGVGRMGIIQLHTYGVLVAVGFLIGIILAVKEAKRVGVNPEKVLDLSFWLLISAMVGARLFYIGLNWETFATDLKDPSKVWYQWKVFRLWEGGLLYYGGFILALMVCWSFVRFNKLPFWKLADIIIPSVAIGQFFGHLGSFAAGFGYGKASNVGWSVLYTTGRTAPQGTSLHPTQLYEALGVLLIFFVLIWIRSGKRYHGQTFLWYTLLYPAVSFVVEIFRGDPLRGFVFQKDITPWSLGADIMSWSQLISIALFLITIVLFSTRKTNSATKLEPNTN